MEKLLLKFLLLAPAILVAITVHECGHAFAAWRLGDDSAYRLGRVSLNPIRHLDVTGTLVFMLTAWMGMGFGWAKPVPTNLRRINNLRLGFIAVSAAGPASNLLTAFILSLLFKLCLVLFPLFFLEYNLHQFILTMIWINLVLAFFNLLPLPPLDGSGIVTGLLTPSLAWHYQRIARYGIFILLALIILPTLITGFPDILEYLVRQPSQSLYHFLVRKWM